jgi:hypothetical protein
MNLVPVNIIHDCTPLLLFEYLKSTSAFSPFSVSAIQRQLESYFYHELSIHVPPTREICNYLNDSLSIVSYSEAICQKYNLPKQPALLFHHPSIFSLSQYIFDCTQLESQQPKIPMFKLQPKPEAQEMRFYLPNGIIAAKAYGESTASHVFLLFPDIGKNANALDFLATELICQCPTAFILSVDLPGHGFSSLLSETNYSLIFLENILAMLKILNIKTVHLVCTGKSSLLGVFFSQEVDLMSFSVLKTSKLAECQEISIQNKDYFDKQVADFNWREFESLLEEVKKPLQCKMLLFDSSNFFEVSNYFSVFSLPICTFQSFDSCKHHVFSDSAKFLSIEVFCSIKTLLFLKTSKLSFRQGGENDVY